MSAGTYNLVIDQGSDFALDLVVKQSGSALNLANYSGRAQLRTSHSSSSIAATFTVTVTNAANGALKMQLPGNTSKNIAAGGGKVVIAYRHNNAGHKRCQVRCGTVSGTSITWGSIFEPDTSNEGNQFGVHYDSLSDKFIVTTRRQNEEQRSFVLNISFPQDLYLLGLDH